MSARPRSGQQLVDPALGIILHARDDVGEIGKQVDPARLTLPPPHSAICVRTDAARLARLAKAEIGAPVVVLNFDDDL